MVLDGIRAGWLENDRRDYQLLFPSLPVERVVSLNLVSQRKRWLYRRHEEIGDSLMARVVGVESVLTH